VIGAPVAFVRGDPANGVFVVRELGQLVAQTVDRFGPSDCVEKKILGR